MTNHVPELRQRGPRGPYNLRKKLRRALWHLTEGRPLPEAAALARMTAQSLRVALRKPHILALVGEHPRVPLSKAVSAFERVTALRLSQPLRPHHQTQSLATPAHNEGGV